MVMVHARTCRHERKLKGKLKENQTMKQSLHEAQKKDSRPYGLESRCTPY